MKQPSKEEFLTFAKMAAEGRAYLLQLHYPFHLPGRTNARELWFFDGLDLVARWEGESTKDKADNQWHESKAKRENAAKALGTLLNLVKGDLKAEDAAKRLRRWGSPGREWSYLPGQIEARLHQSPDLRELLQQFLQFSQLRLAAVGKQQAAVEQALDCFATLGAAAIDRGDDCATAMLVELTRYAVTILDALIEQRPAQVRPHARKSVQWPVLASVEPDWQWQTQQKLAKTLELGEDTLHGRLDRSKAYNLENVSRRYARGIVDTLEKNRCCAALLPMQEQIIKAKQKKDGIKVLLKAIPAWVTDATKLEPFSRETAEDWLDVGMKMLKEQCPHLPKSDDWARITRHWENRGDKPTAGRMWNSIKDALKSPIKTIARSRAPRTVTRIPQPNLGNRNRETNKV